jgi:BirA family transcriptional regulator, biotin operon repressor / biotin---[acetyl-CoA-carboxylase] ligase
VLSEQALVRVLERVGVDAPVRFEEVTGSTNATALSMAAGGAPEWTLVAAAHQTAGRGRLGRSWLDVAGRALMFSVVLRPEIDADRAGLITLLAGSAMARACRTVARGDVRCKWPNDLLDRPGRKVGGILAETVIRDGRFDHVVLGIGVNLDRGPADVPGSAGVAAEPEALLGAFVETFAAGYEPASGGFGERVLGAYRPLCETLGRAVRATTTDGRVVEGEAVDVDHAGALLIRTEDRVEVVRSGEIEHLVT